MIVQPDSLGEVIRRVSLLYRLGQRYTVGGGCRLDGFSERQGQPGPKEQPWFFGQESLRESISSSLR